MYRACTNGSASGIRKRFRTANSGFEAYGHAVEFHAFGVTTHSLIHFFADPTNRQKCIEQERLG